MQKIFLAWTILEKFSTRRAMAWPNPNTWSYNSLQIYALVYALSNGVVRVAPYISHPKILKCSAFSRFLMTFRQ